MAANSILVDLNLNKNELQNAVIQNLASAPSSPVAGQLYFNTTDKILYLYDGTQWVDATSQGQIYTFTAPLSETGGVVTIGDASTSSKGVIEIATDTEASTGTSETLAVNPKQLATKVTANAAITGATKTKITYDSKGLVTAGTDLEASDIPNLTLSKITDVTATATELNVLDGITASTTELNYVDGVTSAIQTQIDNKVTKNADITSGTGTVITYDTKGLVTGSSEIGIDSGSTDYLEFDTTNHNIKAKVDTTVTENSTKLITSGAVFTAIGNAVVGGVTYQGTWDITSATDYSGITLPVKKGYLYYVIGTGPKTIGGIEWNAGDYLLVNDDVAAGGSLTGKVEKIDNTESADIVRLNSTQTLTNKTIDADDNTIQDLTTTNFKSGTVVTTIGPATGTGAATDTELPTAKAVRTELNNKTGKITANNTLLTPSSGVCTWTISNTLATADVIVNVYEIATGDQVFVATTVGSSTITIKINSTANIAADTYKAVIVG